MSNKSKTDHIILCIYVSLGIQSYSQMMIGVSNHLLTIVFRFHYHSQEVIGSLGYTNTYTCSKHFFSSKASEFPRLGSASGTHRPSHQRGMAMSTSRIAGERSVATQMVSPLVCFFLINLVYFFGAGGEVEMLFDFGGCIFVDDVVQIL